MTIEEKKNYLKRYKRAVAKIKALDEELHNLDLDALPGGIDYSKDKIQTTPTNDQMVNHMIRLEELITSINTTKIKAVEVCSEILYAIDTVDNDTYQTILHRRYILLQTWEEIGVAMSYSTQRLYELHCEALAELTIPKEQRETE